MRWFWQSKLPPPPVSRVDVGHPVWCRIFFYGDDHRARAEEELPRAIADYGHPAKVEGGFPRAD